MPNVGDSIDRYVIEAVIGEGGMGRVYRALDPRLGRRVALKILLADGTNEKVRTEAAARMIREARAAAAFNHPNVIAIHDVGEFEGNPFITMELVSGSTLRAYVGDANLSNEHRLEWLLDVARGLGAAHRAGLVHRDIKPENVMVTTDGVVKILDFGIARRTEDPAVDSGAPTAAAHLASLTAEGMMIGTPQYMPPEQLQGEPLDGRADQFAWGVMAWELFAGVLPWGASKNGAQLVAAVLATPVRPLRDVVPGVEQAVSDAVARALSKNRDTRFKTMEELLVAFEGKRALAPLPSSQDVAFQPTAAQPSAPGTSRPEATPTKPSERPPSGPGGPLTTGAAGSVARTGDQLAASGRARSAMPVVVIGVVVAGAAAIAFALGVGHRGSPSEATSDASIGATDAAPAGPLVGACGEGVKNTCSAGARAWCDVDDKVIACCASDLAATGKDGVCDCAPGGTEPDAGASSCPKAKQTGVAGAESVVQAIRPRLRACYEQGLAKNESLAGSMVIGLEIAPDGRVFRGRIKEGRMASPIVQRCVLDELRKARFEPPAGGSSAMEIPVRFEQRGEDDATSIPGRHPCREKGTCAADAKAWCDADEKELACCAQGLVAVSRDGMCDCPPGGVTSPVGNCPRATTTKKEYDAALHEGAISKPLMECIFAADAGSVGGTLKMHVTYDPDGKIGDVRVTRGALPQVFAQRCVLDAVRALKAPPPPDGTWTSDVSLEIQPPPKK